MTLALTRERPGMPQGESRAKRGQRQDLTSSGSLDPAVPEAGALDVLGVEEDTWLTRIQSEQDVLPRARHCSCRILGSPFVCDP